MLLDLYQLGVEIVEEMANISLGRVRASSSLLTPQIEALFTLAGGDTLPASAAGMVCRLSRGDLVTMRLSFERIDDSMTHFDIIEGRYTDGGATYWDFNDIALE